MSWILFELFGAYQKLSQKNEKQHIIPSLECQLKQFGSNILQKKLFFQ